MAVLGAEVRGRNAFRSFVVMESVAVTSAQYTGADLARRQAGQYVSVSGSLPLSRYEVTGAIAHVS